MRSIALCTLAVLMLAGCGGGTGTANDRTGTVSSETTGLASAPAEQGPTTSESGTRPTLPPPSVPPGVEASVGAVPEELLEELVAAAAVVLSIEPASVEVMRAQQVVWGDASLGCPQAGHSYIQVLTPGYWVVLAGGGLEVDYRAPLDGEFSRCLGGGPPTGVLVER